MGMFGFLPNNLFINHRGANTSGLSPRLWSRVTGTAMQSDGSKRLILVGDDFNAPKAADTYTDVYSEVAYTSYIDTGGTLLGLADEKGGVLALAMDNTDNDEIWMEAGDGTIQLGQISDTAGDDHLTAFECRVKFSSIVDGVCSFFAGLATPGLAAADTMTDDTGALAAAKSFIGFRNLLDGDGVDCYYQAVSQTGVTSISDAHTLVADTFVKLGFLYDPSAPASKRITWYVDNVEQSTYVTATQIATATFPDAEALTFLFGYKNTIGTTPSTTEGAIDWWAFAQLV